MPVYKLGSAGEEVRALQERLAAEGLYTGRLDGRFGGGTRAAVQAWQRRQGLPADGEVGATAWEALFGAPIPAPALATRPLAQRCLALTGSFETSLAPPDCFGCTAGNFDGQGLSFGALQWNLGQGTLQPLLAELLRDHRPMMEEVFQDRLPPLEAALAGDRAQQMAFARGLQSPQRHAVHEPWRGLFAALGRTPACQELQVREVAAWVVQAGQAAARYGLWSERGVALLFDIRVQNGTISAAVQERVLEDMAALPLDLPPEDREVAVLRSLARRRADAANPRFAADVRSRKLCIAEGRGVVHGIHYDLEEQFGIRLVPA